MSELTVPAPAPPLPPQSRARLVQLMLPEMIELVLDMLGYEVRARAQMQKVCRQLRWNRKFPGWRALYSKIIRHIGRSRRRPNLLHCIICAGPIPHRTRCAFKGEYCRARCESAGWFNDPREYAQDHDQNIEYNEALDDFVHARTRTVVVRHYERRYGAPYHYDSSRPVLKFKEMVHVSAGQPVGFDLF